MSEQGHRNDSVTRALRAFAAADETPGASAAVEARLLEAAHEIARKRRRDGYARAIAIAAALVLAIAIPMWQASTPDQPPGTSSGAARRAATAAATNGEMTTEFFPLKYSYVPARNPQTVRLELPFATLASFGIADGEWPGPPPQTILADVVVGEDGLARAVRFVRSAADVTDSKEQTP